MRTALAVVLLLACLRVQAAPSPAEQLLQKGLRSYAVGEYDDAIAAFKRGYELEPRAEFLYALGQAQRMQGDCREAVASYRAYLRTSPPERSAAPARENLKRCEAQLAAAPPAATTTSPPAATTTSPPATTTSPPATGAAADGSAPAATSERPRRRWWRDPAGDALGGVGVAAIATGAALWGVGESGARSLVDATQYGQFAAHGAQADTFDHERTAGIVTLAVGGGLVLAAIVRWSVIARRR